MQGDAGGATLGISSDIYGFVWGMFGYCSGKFGSKIIGKVREFLRNRNLGKTIGSSLQDT